VMTFLHDERAVFPATRAAFEHEARDALKAIKPGRRGVKSLYEILDEYLELKQERKEREDRKACFKFSIPCTTPVLLLHPNAPAPCCTSLGLSPSCLFSSCGGQTPLRTGRIRRPRSKSNG
jgi:hypothetical protein